MRSSSFSLAVPDWALGPILLALGLFAWTGCGGTWDVQNSQDASAILQREFGLLIGDRSQPIRCRVVNIADTSSVWFAFESSEQEIERLTAGFEVAGRTELMTGVARLSAPVDLFEPNPNAPKWWPNLSKLQFDRVHFRQLETPSSNGYMYVVWDNHTKCAYAKTAKWR